MDKKLQGKKNREAGRRFEAKVRRDLEDQGYIVDRWTNNIVIRGNKDKIKDWKENEGGRLVSAKSNRFNLRTTGFPDFIAFKELCDGYVVFGIECKSNGQLSRDEKEKLNWYSDKKIFSNIFIAKKGKKRGEIEYVTYKRN